MSAMDSARSRTLGCGSPILASADNVSDTYSSTFIAACRSRTIRAAGDPEHPSTTACRPTTSSSPWTAWPSSSGGGSPGRSAPTSCPGPGTARQPQPSVLPRPHALPCHASVILLTVAAPLGEERGLTVRSDQVRIVRPVERHTAPALVHVPVAGRVSRVAHPGEGEHLRQRQLHTVE